MKKNIISLPTAIIIFISGYSPLFLIMVIKDFDFTNHIMKNTHLSIFLISVSIISIILLILIMKNLKIDGFFC